jgi:hypothetical protein
LQRLGLALKRVEPLDMIPWSDAIEALAWFEPAAPPPPRVLFEDERFLAVEKAAHEPLLGPGDGQPSLTQRVRQLPGCEHALALDAWGAVVSGVCWFAKRQAATAPAKLESTARLLVLARGNLRKQGTITRRSGDAAGPGSRYKKQADVGRHSLLDVLTHDSAETGTLRDFMTISHPVLGDAANGDAASNQFMAHRHGLDRAFVHCKSSRLGGDDMQAREASCELAPDLARVVASLGSD